MERAAARQASNELLQQYRAAKIAPGGPRDARSALGDGHALEVVASDGVRRDLQSANASLAIISTDNVATVAANTRRARMASNKVDREQDVAFSDALLSYTEQGRGAADRMLPNGASHIGGVSAFAKAAPVHAAACAFHFAP